MSTQEIIKKLRSEKGLTQEEISKILGVPRSTYAKWEINITPDYSMVKKIAKFLTYRLTTF